MRGLKRSFLGRQGRKACVARFPRAWIETGSAAASGSAVGVARFPRAWIETSSLAVRTHPEKLSHASRVRGLKRNVDFDIAITDAVARFPRAWIETSI